MNKTVFFNWFLSQKRGRIWRSWSRRRRCKCWTDCRRIWYRRIRWWFILWRLRIQVSHVSLAERVIIGETAMYRSDSNFIPRISKKFEYWNFDSTIRIYIENEPETQKHEVPWLSNSLKFFNLKFWNFNALSRKYCFLDVKSDWRIWKRASRSCPHCIMKVY